MGGYMGNTESTVGKSVHGKTQSFKKVIYLLLAMLSLCCQAGFSLELASRCCSLVVV